MERKVLTNTSFIIYLDHIIVYDLYIYTSFVLMFSLVIQYQYARLFPVMC